jgi:hypothetical protein
MASPERPGNPCAPVALISKRSVLWCWKKVVDW